MCLCSVFELCHITLHYMFLDEVWHMSVWCLQVYKIVNRTECENSTWNQNLAWGCQSLSKRLMTVILH